MNLFNRKLRLESSKFFYWRALVINRFKNLSSRIALTILNGKTVGTRLGHGEEILLELSAANFVSSQGLNIASDIYKAWHQANYYFGRGYYWESVEFRLSALERLYKSQDIATESNYYPKLVSSSYTAAIGHLGALHVNNIAQRIGILSQGPRYVLAGRNVANEAALNFVAEHIVPIGTYDPSGLLTLSSLIENYQIVRCKQSFLDRFQLWEKVYEALEYEKNSYVQSEGINPVENLEAGKEVLLRIGVNLENPIALIHLRNNGNIKETRNVDASTYVEGISYLQQSGYQVCQIGVNHHNSLGHLMKDIYTVPNTTRQDREANFYLLKNCNLFVGTTSGPAIFPTVLGRPSLITNLTSFSRNAFSSKSTLYLPKKILTLNGKQLSLEEQFSSRFAFGGEFLVEQLRKGGVRFQDNSSKEILDSLAELLSRLKSGQIEGTSCDKVLREIQERSKSVAKGLFSNTFLSTNFQIV